MTMARLEAASRVIDRRLGWRPDAFVPLGAATLRVWPSVTSRTLWLRDSEGQAWPLRAWTRLRVDCAGRGRPDFDWQPTDVAGWVISEPDGAVGRPIRQLRLWETHDSAVLVRWPSPPGVVDVTGTWGWAATPPPIRDLTVYLARSMGDTLLGGASATVAMLDSGVPMRDEGAILWRRVEMEFAALRPGRLGVPSVGAGR